MNIESIKKKYNYKTTFACKCCNIYTTPSGVTSEGVTSKWRRQKHDRLINVAVSDDDYVTISAANHVCSLSFVDLYRIIALSESIWGTRITTVFLDAVTIDGTAMNVRVSVVHRFLKGDLISIAVSDIELLFKAESMQEYKEMLETLMDIY